MPDLQRRDDEGGDGDVSENDMLRSIARCTIQLLYIVNKDFGKFQEMKSLCFSWWVRSVD
ncbi:hypothetical protein HMPREF1148_2178 [Selenomonas sp. FOBRC6]|nr:hypothetical protein HMPREF1148_2178 [Selenomonas sp. FOBRC6]